MPLDPGVSLAILTRVVQKVVTVHKDWGEGPVVLGDRVDCLEIVVWVESDVGEATNRRCNVKSVIPFGLHLQGQISDSLAKAHEKHVKSRLTALVS